MSTRRAKALAALAITALIPLSACTRTTDGVARSDGTVPPPDAGTSESRESRDAPVLGGLNLPDEVEGITPLSGTQDMSLRQLVNAVATHGERVWDALGIDIDAPVTFPRTSATGCLSGGHVAGLCSGKNTIEYRSDLLQQGRDTYGDMFVVLIISHEVAHVAARKSGNDGAHIPDNAAEARANCGAGVYLSMNPRVSPTQAGNEYMRTPLHLSGRDSYTAFQRGFDLTRSGENPAAFCVTYTP